VHVPAMEGQKGPVNVIRQPKDRSEINKSTRGKGKICIKGRIPPLTKKKKKNETEEPLSEKRMKKERPMQIWLKKTVRRGI